MLKLLNPCIDLNFYREQFQTSGLVEVEDFLTPEAAERLHQFLDRAANWNLVYLSWGKVHQIPLAQLTAMDPDARERLERQIAEQAARGFQFRFMRFPVADANNQNAPPTDLCPELSEEFIQKELVEFSRQVTADPEIRRTSMFASFYPPGSYLRSHDDRALNDNRRAAYVLNLTRNWNFDWGGLLVIEDKKRARVQRALLPRFNSLVLFKVPRSHHVTPVCAYAQGQRYALQGWFSAAGADGR